MYGAVLEVQEPDARPEPGGQLHGGSATDLGPEGVELQDDVLVQRLREDFEAGPAAEVLTDLVVVVVVPDGDACVPGKPRDAVQTRGRRFDVRPRGPALSDDARFDERADSELCCHADSCGSVSIDEARVCAERAQRCLGQRTPVRVAVLLEPPQLHVLESHRGDARERPREIGLDGLAQRIELH
nr:hypothetical protein [Streptomyces achromogenes]